MLLECSEEVRPLIELVKGLQVFEQVVHLLILFKLLLRFLEELVLEGMHAVELYIKDLLDDVKTLTRINVVNSYHERVTHLSLQTK